MEGRKESEEQGARAKIIIHRAKKGGIRNKRLLKIS